MRYCTAAVLALSALVFAAAGTLFTDARGLAVALVLIAFCPLIAFMETMATRAKPAATQAAGFRAALEAVKRGRR